MCHLAPLLCRQGCPDSPIVRRGMSWTLHVTASCKDKGLRMYVCAVKFIFWPPFVSACLFFVSLFLFLSFPSFLSFLSFLHSSSFFKLVLTLRPHSFPLSSSRLTSFFLISLFTPSNVPGLIAHLTSFILHTSLIKQKTPAHTSHLISFLFLLTEHSFSLIRTQTLSLQQYHFAHIVPLAYFHPPIHTILK